MKIKFSWGFLQNWNLQTTQSQSSLTELIGAGIYPPQYSPWDPWGQPGKHCPGETSFRHAAISAPPRMLTNPSLETGACSGKRLSCVTPPKPIVLVRNITRTYLKLGIHPPRREGSIVIERYTKTTDEQMKLFCAPKLFRNAPNFASWGKK